jgi:2-deoxy-D-gluconate 3-dehydrogenase
MTDASERVELTTAARTTPKLFDLSGRVAAVTGGAGLLGRVFSAALLDLGAIVHVLDVDAARLDAACRDLAAETGRAPVEVVCDITDTGSLEPAIDGIKRAGSLDILVNSAALDPKFGPSAGLPAGHIARYALEEWRRSLEVNLTGMFLATQAAIRVMLTQGPAGRGAIVNIASTYALVGPDQRIYTSGQDGTPEQDGGFVKPVDYATTKAGVLGFTRAVAAQLRDTEIRVNALTPGGAEAGHPGEFVDAYSSRTILGRMAQPHEYRGAIAFLCSDASSYMTGANLVVDGGWTAL